MLAQPLKAQRVVISIGALATKQGCLLVQQNIRVDLPFSCRVNDAPKKAIIIQL
jgi:hypothetical protein